MKKSEVISIIHSVFTAIEFTAVFLMAAMIVVCGIIL